MRRTLAFVVTASLLLLCISGCKKPDASKENSHPIPVAAPLASASSASPAATARVYEVSATAKAARTATLSPKGAGVLRSIRAREGDRVKAGQVLCVLDTTDTSIRSDGARVAQAQAAEAIKNAQSDLDRARMLFDAGALPDQSIEKAELALKMARLSAQAADVGYRMTRQAAADANLVAPFDGVITKVLAEEGQLITSMPPVMVFVLADTDTLEVRAPIPERRLAQIKMGMAVRVILHALDVERDAKIDRMSEVLDPVTHSVEAVIRLDNRDHALPAGLYATVRFPTLAADEKTDDAPKDKLVEKGK